jgi:hypothetical protein
VTEVTSEPMVRMKHVRGAKLCSGGCRAWFRRHNLDWNVFLKSGIPASVIEATGDPFALRAAERARADDGRG